MPRSIDAADPQSTAHTPSSRASSRRAEQPRLRTAARPRLHPASAALCAHPHMAGCQNGECLRQYCCPPCEEGLTDCSCGRDEGDCAPQCNSFLCARVAVGPNYRAYVGWCGGESCAPAPCPNYALCSCEAPWWYLQAHSNRCGNCNVLMNADVVELVAEPFECAVCLEATSVAARLQGCSHVLCVSCFKDCGFYDPGSKRVRAGAPASCPLCRAQPPPVAW